MARRAVWEAEGMRTLGLLSIAASGAGIFSPVITRYRAGWLQHRGAP